MTAPYRLSRALEVLTDQGSGIELGSSADIKGIYYYQDDPQSDSRTPTWIHELEIKYSIEMEDGIFYVKRDGTEIIETMPIEKSAPSPAFLQLYTQSDDPTTMKVRIHKDPILRKSSTNLRVSANFDCSFKGIYQREEAARHGKISYFSLHNTFHIHWSRRRERWELSAPQWPGMITIHGEHSRDSSSPASRNWIEHGSDRKFQVVKMDEKDEDLPDIAPGSLINIENFLQEPTAMKVAFNMFWRPGMRTQEFAKLAWVQKLHHTDMKQGMEPGNELRLILGIPENHLASILKTLLPEYLAVCASEFCGPQITTLCLTRNKIRIVCGWSYVTFENNFDVDLQKILRQISYMCGWHQDLQAVVNRRNAWVLL